MLGALFAPALLVTGRASGERRCGPRGGVVGAPTGQPVDQQADHEPDQGWHHPPEAGGVPGQHLSCRATATRARSHTPNRRTASMMTMAKAGELFIGTATAATSRTVKPAA